MSIRLKIRERLGLLRQSYDFGVTEPIQTNVNLLELKLNKTEADTSLKKVFSTIEAVYKNYNDEDLKWKDVLKYIRKTEDMDLYYIVNKEINKLHTKIVGLGSSRAGISMNGYIFKIAYANNANAEELAAHKSIIAGRTGGYDCPWAKFIAIPLVGDFTVDNEIILVFPQIKMTSFSDKSKSSDDYLPSFIDLQMKLIEETFTDTGWGHNVGYLGDGLVCNDFDVDDPMSTQNYKNCCDTLDLIEKHYPDLWKKQQNLINKLSEDTLELI